MVDTGRLGDGEATPAVIRGRNGALWIGLERPDRVVAEETPSNRPFRRLRDQAPNLGGQGMLQSPEDFSSNRPVLGAEKSSC
jgi:hypothetical protein